MTSKMINSLDNQETWNEWETGLSESVSPSGPATAAHRNLDLPGRLQHQAHIDIAQWATSSESCLPGQLCYLQESAPREAVEGGLRIWRVWWRQSILGGRGVLMDQATLTLRNTLRHTLRHILRLT